MILDRVTVTGADDSIAHENMIRLSWQYPFVEWGILVSKNSPRFRFPSRPWLEELKNLRQGEPSFLIFIPPINLSCHVCGQWTRDICFKGEVDPYLETVLPMFQRVQLNFHAIVHKLDRDLFISALKRYPDKQFIFQLDNVNNGILDVAKDAGVNACPLFDTSGGIGQLPAEWPDIRGKTGYYGYAGGLSPDNLRKQMEKIQAVAGDNPIWIDAETHLRSEDDSKFLMNKVESFLSVAKEFMA